jgi:hypothetical protein
MIIRYGTYSLYKGVEMNLSNYYGHGINQDIDENHRIISYPKEYGYIDGFEFNEINNRYNKDILLKDLENAFFITTKAIYLKTTFTVESSIIKEFITLKSDNYNQFEKIGYIEYCVGDEKNISESELNKTRYFKVHNGYIISVEICLIEKLWEERTVSSYNLPMPEGIKEYEEIEIPKF